MMCDSSIVCCKCDSAGSFLLGESVTTRAPRVSVRASVTSLAMSATRAGIGSPADAISVFSSTGSFAEGIRRRCYASA